MKCVQINCTCVLHKLIDECIKKRRESETEKKIERERKIKRPKKRKRESEREEGECDIQLDRERDTVRVIERA